MFAVGHLALGYLLAKAAQKLLKTEVNLPLIFFLSLIPDADLLIPGLVHRSISHSVIIVILLFIPFFLYYREKSIPYFIATAQHALVGDLLTNGGAEIFWPLTTAWFGLGLDMRGWGNILLEWASFLLAMAVLIRTNDLKLLLKPSRSSLLLVVPAGAILVSAFIGEGAAPIELLIPHLVLLALFAFAILSYVLSFGHSARSE
ncbi:MAG TPA: metal-dependent hydrolase [Candidatus Bathyarchaeia archaeon]|jgi:hypothetical protein|nr:metal-dependent hydrolase [Candidatus Bathyarchaeia archaeon]